MHFNPVFVPAAVALVALLLPIKSPAGTSDAAPGKQPVAAVEPGPVSPLWEVTVRPYGWLAGLTGTTGVKGFTVETDVPFKDILDHLDMVGALQLEARRDRWMVLFDGLYMKMSGDGETPGRLLSTVGFEVEQVMAEVALGYRVWEGKRGYLDLLAGARYIYMGGDLTFNLDSDGVQSFSEDLSQEAVSRVGSAVRAAVNDALPEFADRAQDRLTAAAEQRIRRRVEEILRNHPNLGKGLLIFSQADGPVSDAIRELIKIRVAEKQEGLSDAASAASAEVAAAKARGKKKLQSAVARAEKNLARAIASAIEDTVPDHVSGSEEWIDPFVGFRGRFNFNDRFYAVGRADIGGFGVGSELAWQLYAGLGWQMTRNTTLELGYRVLYVDYTHGGFTYDATIAGVFTGLGIRF